MAQNIQRRVDARANGHEFPARPKEVVCQQQACHCRAAHHYPQSYQRHVTHRLPHSVDHARRRIQQFEAVQIKSPSQCGHENQEQHRHMLNGMVRDLYGPPSREPEQSE